MRKTIGPESREDAEKDTFRMKKYAVKFFSEDWQKLKVHFAEKGIPVSTGVRLIVKEWMQKNS